MVRSYMLHEGRLAAKSQRDLGGLSETAPLASVTSGIGQIDFNGRDRGSGIRNITDTKPIINESVLQVLFRALLLLGIASTLFDMFGLSSLIKV